jgi:glc operon protein GlcG
MRQKPCLTHADAQTMIAAAKAEATAHKWNVSIAIVDDGGNLLHLERMDGPPALSAEVATGKARTAALMRRPSKFWEERLAERPGFLRFPNILPIQGGLPILHEGECVGGIGVSGVQSHEDEQIAQAGITALG